MLTADLNKKRLKTLFFIAEENSQNINNNLAIKIIIWLAGIMILVFGGIYLLDKMKIIEI